MAECNLGFMHEEPEPVVIEEAPDTEPIAEAEVRIAEINASRDVAVAKIEHRSLDDELIARIAALEAANESYRAQLAPNVEEQEQAVVVVADPEPEPEVTEPAPEVKDESPEPKAKARRNPFWS